MGFKVKPVSLSKRIKHWFSCKLGNHHLPHEKEYQGELLGFDVLKHCAYCKQKVEVYGPPQQTIYWNPKDLEQVKEWEALVRPYTKREQADRTRKILSMQYAHRKA